MNADGETFEERPIPGEYKRCPLHGCAWKLLVPAPPGYVHIGVQLLTVTTGGDTLASLAQAAMIAEARRQEDLVKAHLKTHKMVDFYTTMDWLFQDYREKVGKIEKLLDLVFEATAVQESAEGGE